MNIFNMIRDELYLPARVQDYIDSVKKDINYQNCGIGIYAAADGSETCNNKARMIYWRPEYGCPLRVCNYHSKSIEKWDKEQKFTGKLWKCRLCIWR